MYFSDARDANMFINFMARKDNVAETCDIAEMDCDIDETHGLIVSSMPI